MSSTKLNLFYNLGSSKVTPKGTTMERMGRVLCISSFLRMVHWGFNQNRIRTLKKREGWLITGLPCRFQCSWLRKARHQGGKNISMISKVYVMYMSYERTGTYIYIYIFTYVYTLEFSLSSLRGNHSTINQTKHSIYHSLDQANTSSRHQPKP